MRETLTIDLILHTKPLTHDFFPTIPDIDGEFKSCLKQLVPMLLAPENLVTKKIGGATVKARDLLNYFKSYVEVFNSEELPNPMTILQVSLSLVAG